MRKLEPTLAYLVPELRGIRDEASKNWTLVDLFSAIFIPRDAEAINQAFCVAGRINDVKGGENCETVVSLRDSENTTVAEAKMSGKLVDGDVQFVANFPPVRFEKEGRYYLKAYYNKQVLDDDKKYYFDVKKMPFAQPHIHKMP